MSTPNNRDRYSIIDDSEGFVGASFRQGDVLEGDFTITDTSSTPAKGKPPKGRMALAALGFVVGGAGVAAPVANEVLELGLIPDPLQTQQHQTAPTPGTHSGVTVDMDGFVAAIQHDGPFKLPQS